MFIRPMAFKAAGNTLIMISRNWDKLVTYQVGIFEGRKKIIHEIGFHFCFFFQEEYNHQSDVDLDLAEHISHHTDEEDRDWVIKFPATVEEAALLGVRSVNTFSFISLQK